MTQMRTRAVLPRLAVALVLMAAAVALVLPGLSSADGGDDQEPYPQPSYRFYGFHGSVTIDDEPAPNGALIEAWADGEMIGSGEVAQGSWNIDVDYGTSGITFTVNGLSDLGGPRDAMLRGGQAMINLRAVSAADDQDSECPDAAMMESDESDADSDMMESDEDTLETEAETVVEDCPDDDLELSFPNSGQAGLSGGGLAPIAFGAGAAALLLAALGVIWARRRQTAPRV